MKNPISKETKYVNSLIGEKRRVRERIMTEDISQVRAAYLCGCREGINYAIQTFCNIYLGDKE